MLQHHIKIALRNLWRSKEFSFINVFGLAVGMTIALFIALWIWDELNYNNFHENKDRLYKLYNTSTFNGETETYPALPLPLGDELRNNYPEIKRLTRSSWGWNHGLKVGDNLLYKDGLEVDQDFLEMFSFSWLAGNKESALIEPQSIVLTASSAESLFGHRNFDNIVSQSITYNNSSELIVTGIMEDAPANSTLDFNFLIPFTFFEKNNWWVSSSKNSWDIM